MTSLEVEGEPVNPGSTSYRLGDSGKSHSLSVPQFLHAKVGDDHRTGIKMIEKVKSDDTRET